MNYLTIITILLLAHICATAQPAREEKRLKDSRPKVAEGWVAGPLKGAPPSVGYRWFTIDAFNNELHALYFHATPEYKPNYLIYCYSPDNGKSWTFDTVDGTEGVMAHVDNLYSMATFNGAIAVDHCGVPHLFYTVNHFHPTSTKPSWAIHAQKVNGQWIRDTVEARPQGQSSISFDVDMVIGSDNEPRVVYIHGEDEPMFGVRVGGKWKIEPVGGVGPPRYLWNSLTLDSRNIPHILLGKFTGIEYATVEEGMWKVRPNFIHVGGIGDIVTDRENRPHIIFGSDFSPIFRHAVLETSGWKTSPLESIAKGDGGGGKRGRIKRDAEGTLHAVYYGHIDYRTYKAGPDGSDRYYEEGDDGYYDEQEPERIIYAHSTDNGGTWKEEIVEYVGSVYVEGSYPDIVITESMIGLFYKGEDEIPRFAYKKHSKPGFRKSKPNNCGQE